MSSTSARQPEKANPEHAEEDARRREHEPCPVVAARATFPSVGHGKGRPFQHQYPENQRARGATAGAEPRVGKNGSREDRQRHGSRQQMVIPLSPRLGKDERVHRGVNRSQRRC